MAFDISCNFNHKLLKIVMWLMWCNFDNNSVRNRIQRNKNSRKLLSFCVFFVELCYNTLELPKMWCYRQFGVYLINLWPPENQDLGSSVIKLVCMLFEDTLHTIRQQLPQVCLWYLIDELNKDSVCCLGRSFTHFHWDKLRAFHREGHSARDVRGNLMGHVSIYTDCE